METFIKGIGARLVAIFDPAVLQARIADILGKFVIALIVFAAFYFLWRILLLLTRPVIRRAKLDHTATAFFEAVLKYTVLAVGAINALAAIGVNTAGVLASFGIAGLTIGFAAKDALSNLVSGILIFMDRPFVIGDLVEIGEDYGEVSRITLRSTRIITADGKMLAVPNSEIINRTVASYTNFPHLRIDVPVSIGVTESIDRARDLILAIIRADPEYLATPPPRVVVTALNDYNIALEVQAWLKNERRHGEKRVELLEKIFRTLDTAGVDMPFETIRLEPLTVRSEGLPQDRP